MGKSMMFVFGVMLLAAAFIGVCLLIKYPPVETISGFILANVQ